jgi:tripeptidyl-peptidase-1
MAPFQTLLAAVLLAPLALASAPRISRAVVHEQRSAAPRGWSKLARHAPDAVLPMRFGLAQSNLDKLDEYLMDVSHPDSPNYGQHWTPAKVTQTFAPSSDTVDTVKEWLAMAGILPERIKTTAGQIWLELK